MILDIIIPQYKEDESVIKNLLNSKNDQKNVDFSQIKLTIVNDKSDCLLSDKFLKSFNNLDITFMINDRNTGPGLARQKGFDNTNGLFVMFCDSDDELYDSNTLSIIMDFITKYEPDYLVTNISVERENGNEIKKGKDTFPWMHGKVYKREFLINNDIRFHERIRHVEDAYFTTSIIGVIDEKNISFLDVPTYKWKANKESLTRAKYKHHYLVEIFDDFYNLSLDLYEFLKKKNSKIKMNYAISSIFGIYLVLNSDLFDYPDLEEKKNLYLNKLHELVKKRRNMFVIYGKDKVEKIYEIEFREIVKRNGIKTISKDLNDFYAEYLQNKEF